MSSIDEESLEQTSELKQEKIEVKKEKKDEFVLNVNHSSKLSNHLASYFNNSELSDVTFDFQGDKIFAHKFILAGRR
jgi:hypothetical protein